MSVTVNPSNSELMDKRSQLLELLGDAGERIAAAQVHVARQRNIIELLTESGEDTAYASKLRDVFEALHDLHLVERDRILSKLRKG